MYYKTKFGEIVKKVGEDYISVPMDESNVLYQEYITYLENNGEVLDTDFVLNNFEEFDKLQYIELKPTDWYVIRKADTGEEIPQEIIDLRNGIRLKYNNLKNN